MKTSAKNFGLVVGT